MSGPKYECDRCKGTRIVWAKTGTDVWEPCPEEHEEIEEE